MSDNCNKENSYWTYLNSFRKNIRKAIDEFNLFERNPEDGLPNEFTAFALYNEKQGWFMPDDDLPSPPVLWRNIKGPLDKLVKLFLGDYIWGWYSFLLLDRLAKQTQPDDFSRYRHMAVNFPHTENVIKNRKFLFAHCIPLTAITLSANEDEELYPVFIIWRNAKGCNEKLEIEFSEPVILLYTCFDIPRDENAYLVKDEKFLSLNIKKFDIPIFPKSIVDEAEAKKLILNRAKKYLQKKQMNVDAIKEEEIIKRICWMIAHTVDTSQMVIKQTIEKHIIACIPSSDAIDASSAILLNLNYDKFIREIRGSNKNVIKDIFVLATLLSPSIEPLQDEIHRIEVEKEKSLRLGEVKGAKLSAIISGHEAGAQLVAMRDLMSYITDERLEKTVRKLIYGSINYIHLYLADNPNTAKIKKFYIAKDESIKSWVKKIAEFSWQIALARGIGDVEPDTKLLLRIEEILENHMPGIDLNIPDNLFFNPSRCIEENYSTFRPTLARWFLAGLSNSIKWSGQIKEGKNLNYWVDKKSTAFKSIRVEISQEDDQTVKIAILNKYHYPYTDLKKDNKIVGTKRVLQVINEDLPVKGGKLTFDFNKSNIEEFETSIILEGEIFKCVINKENQEE
jgi:hypothetical protein